MYERYLKGRETWIKMENGGDMKRMIPSAYCYP